MLQEVAEPKGNDSQQQYSAEHQGKPNRIWLLFGQGDDCTEPERNSQTDQHPRSRHDKPPSLPFPRQPPQQASKTPEYTSTNTSNHASRSVSPPGVGRCYPHAGEAA